MASELVEFKGHLPIHAPSSKSAAGRPIHASKPKE